jgi:NAD(P)-dependent dehydrogenase (short-subunit alcohol dehydrogenase family)
MGAYHKGSFRIRELKVGLLEGKVLLVAGAGRGVGRCIALEAAKEGAKVVVNDLGGDETGKGGKIGRPRRSSRKSRFISSTISTSRAPLRPCSPGVMTSISGLIGNFGQANYMSAKLGVVGLSKSIAMDMQRFNVRSNAIAPFAWTRLVGTIPETTLEEKKRVEGLKRLRPELISPFAVASLTDGAAKVTGQVFGTRANEIFLFSQARPTGTAHTSGGWSPQAVVERVLPALAPSF